MTVESIMSRDLVTVAPDTTLVEVRNLLHEHGFRHLLVVEGNDTLCGVLTDRDVLQALGPFFDTYNEEHRDVTALARPASDIMRSDPTTIGPGTDVETAADLLLDNRITALPVVRGDALVGIVTTKDLLKHFADAS